MFGFGKKAQHLSAEGDNNYQQVGDNYFIQDELQKMPLRRVVKKCVDEMGNDADYCGFVEKLANYMLDIDGENIGLEEKLTQGGRDDLIDKAMQLKEAFAKTLVREQLKPSIQNAYAHILACINTTFHLKITPLIAKNEDNHIIDSKIYDEIIENVYNQLSDIIELNFTMDDIIGMLYFLTGKCHIRWD